MSRCRPNVDSSPGGRPVPWRPLNRGGDIAGRWINWGSLRCGMDSLAIRTTAARDRSPPNRSEQRWPLQCLAIVHAPAYDHVPEGLVRNLGNLVIDRGVGSHLYTPLVCGPSLPLRAKAAGRSLDVCDPQPRTIPLQNLPRGRCHNRPHETVSRPQQSRLNLHRLIQLPDEPAASLRKPCLRT
jgi:hypothetical protein